MHLLSLIKKYNFMKKQTQSYEFKQKVSYCQKEYNKRLAFAFACMVGMFLLALLK